MKLLCNWPARRGWRLSLLSRCAVAALLASCGGSADDEPSREATGYTDNLAEEHYWAADGSSRATPPDTSPADDASAGDTARRSTQALAVVKPHLHGQFGPLHNWPIVPIAMMLNPDGTVLAYGTAAEETYVVWDRAKGTGPDAFLSLDNRTGIDIFCSGQALLLNGATLMAGGNTTLGSVGGFGVKDATIFDPANDSLTAQTTNMAYPRWYPTLVILPNREHLALGGLMDPQASTFASTPEVRDVAGNWRPLTGAINEHAYGAMNGSWSYPRAWVNPRGKVFVLAHSGKMFELDPQGGSGAGVVTQYPATTFASQPSYTSIMYAPGKILSVRRNKQAIRVDLNGTGEPVVASAGQLFYDRKFGTATVLADGTVWFSGGAAAGNTAAGMNDPATESELYVPSSNSWKLMARAQKHRLYHSIAMLLPDGSVFTGGGGVPGPSREENGEIFYPPYLFNKDGSGQRAVQPQITNAFSQALTWGQSLSISANAKIKKVTLVRVGGVTHAYNNETRFFSLATLATPSFTANVKMPASANTAPPGYYMLFVWNEAGVPSEAKIVKIS